jgi:hypothetical protein
LRPGTTTGAISQSNVPSLFAASARSSDVVGERVLAARENSYLVRAVLGERAHQAALVVRVLEAVEEHVVLHHLVAHAIAAARLRHEIRRVGHALHAAGTMTALVPAAMRSCASIAAFIAEPHILFTVVAPTPSGKPALIAAWRAGACPCPPAARCP